MKAPNGVITLNYLDSKDQKDINMLGKALSHPIRTKMIEQIHLHPYTANELAKLNGIDLKNALFHLEILLKANLIEHIYLPSKKNKTSIYALCSGKVNIDFSNKAENQEWIEFQQEMPVGLYVDAKFNNKFRIATQTEMHRLQIDDVFNPVRKNASLLWTTGGEVTYAFNKKTYASKRIRSITFSLEICSETLGFRNDFKSDITFLINNIEIGVHTCPGNYGDIPGKYNPEFWSRNYSQYGDLVIINITKEGTYINHALVSKVNLENINLDSNQYILFTLKNDIKNPHYGGFNIFGKGFGNYDQDILMTISYE